ncbi:hypothetical protein [Lacinutrix sp. MEBiC02404]
MRKTKDILIFIFALLIISAIGYGIFLYFYVQKKYAEVPENKTELVSESESDFNEDDCVFDLNTQTDDFLKEIPEFSNYVWDNEQKKATIKLENGNTLIITRGGCAHFSFYGNLFLNKSELNLNDESGIFKKALQIAEKLFHKSDYELIKELLKNKDYEIEKSENQYYLDFKDDRYCDMTLVVENLTDQNLISIEIGFYQC